MNRRWPSRGLPPEEWPESRWSRGRCRLPRPTTPRGVGACEAPLCIPHLPAPRWCPGSNTVTHPALSQWPGLSHLPLHTGRREAQAAPPTPKATSSCHTGPPRVCRPPVTQMTQCVHPRKACSRQVTSSTEHCQAPTLGEGRLGGKLISWASNRSTAWESTASLTRALFSAPCMQLHACALNQVGNVLVSLSPL